MIHDSKCIEDVVDEQEIPHDPGIVECCRMSEFVHMEKTDVISPRDEEFTMALFKRGDNDSCGRLCFGGTRDADGTMLCSLDTTNAKMAAVLLVFGGYSERGGGWGESQFGRFSGATLNPMS